MKKMTVTLTVQATIEYDDMDRDSYSEKLDLLLQDLQEMDLEVTLESEYNEF